MEDQESSKAWLTRLASLNSVVAAAGEPLAGNLFYDHHQDDYLGMAPLAILRPKRDRFRQAIAGRRRLLEIGINGGHSAYLALTANPELELHGVDICEHAYVPAVVAWLQAEFPGRVSFDQGDCLKVVPMIGSRGLRFDAFHIDGAKHTYYSDVLNCQQIIDGESAVVIIDDTQQPEVARTWRRCVRQGLIAVLPDFEPMTETLKYRNEIGTLRAPVRWRRPVLALYARLLEILRRGLILAARVRRRLRQRLR